jgi:hypothetical protein
MQERQELALAHAMKLIHCKVRLSIAVRYQTIVSQLLR